MGEPVNKIGDAGATALVEALKKITNLEKLHLHREFWMVWYSSVIDCDDTLSECLVVVKVSGGRDGDDGGIH